MRSDLNKASRDHTARNIVIGGATAALATIGLAGCDQKPAAPANTAKTNASPAPQQSPPRRPQVTVIPPGFERAAAGPTYIFHLRDEIYGVVDTVKNQIVFVGPEGKVLGSAALPQDFRLLDIDLGRGVLLSGEQIAPPEKSLAIEVPLDLDVTAGLQLQARAASSAATFTTRAGEALALRGSDFDLTARPSPGNKVLVAKYLGRDRDGRSYAYWEESGRDGAGVLARVGRFDAQGGLQASARVGLDKLAVIPALPVAITPMGKVLLLQPGEAGVSIAELALSSDRSLVPGRPRALGQIDSDVLEFGGVETPAATPAVARALPHPMKPLTQADENAILEKSAKMLNAVWTMRPENYSHAKISSACVKEQGKYWRRPVRYSEASVGKPMSALPYKWGGFDDEIRYIKRIGAPEGALAGDVCTCRDDKYGQCIVPEAAGVDCSGFVSRAWGLKGHTGTSSLGGVSSALPSLAALRPGDALNKAGSHVRLFVRFEPGAELRVRVRESAVSCGGVCEIVYTPAQLKGYLPIRRK